MPTLGAVIAVYLAGCGFALMVYKINDPELERESLPRRLVWWPVVLTGWLVTSFFDVIQDEWFGNDS